MMEKLFKILYFLITSLFLLGWTILSFGNALQELSEYFFRIGAGGESLWSSGMINGLLWGSLFGILYLLHFTFFLKLTKEVK